MGKNIIKKFVVSIFLFGFLLLNARSSDTLRFSEDNHFVVVTAGRNNSLWYKRNLDSFFNQTYKNCEMIYIDDASTDGTADLVENYIKENGQEGRVTLIKNKERLLPLRNQYEAIHTCADTDIIIILDADDWLARDDVLLYLNEVYSDSNIWLTYGQFKMYPSGKKGFCRTVEKHIIDNNKFRSLGFIFSHLRSFYAGLYKKINIKDLMYQEKFFYIAIDAAIMYPMIEMASKGHFKFIPEVLYVYNVAREQKDQRERARLSMRNCSIIRNRKPYKPLDRLF